jgi:WD40 repeat protein
MSPYQHPKMFSDNQGNLFLNFGEYGQEVELACFSADGTRLLTVKDVGVASIWDVASQTQIGEIRPTSPLVGHEGSSSFGADFKVFIESVALNNEGTLALLGLNDGTAGIFSTQNGDRLSKLFPPNTNPAKNWELIRSVAFSPDGSLALVGFHRRAVGVWSTSDHTLIKFLTSPQSDRLFGIPFVRETLTTSVAASQDNGYVFAGFADMAATVWKLDSGEVVFHAHQHVEDITDLWIDDKRVRWATTGGNLWEGSTDQQVFQLLSTGENWIEACFSPDGQATFVRTVDGIIKRWSIEGVSEILAKVNTGLSEKVKAINLGKTKGLSIFIEGTDKIVITTPKSRVEVDRGNKISGLAIPAQEDVLATYGWNTSVELWRIPTGGKLHVLQHNDWVSNVTFSTDGHLLAAGTIGSGGLGKIRPIYVWDVRSGNLWCELKGHTHQVHALAFDPQSRWLVSASLDRTVRLWQLDHETPANSSEEWQLHYEDLEFDRIAVLSDGRFIVFRRNVLEVWQVQQKRLDIQVPHHSGTQWYITKDEAGIWGTFDQQRIRAWSLETGQELPGYQNNVVRPEIVPGATLFSSSQDSFRPTAGCFLWRNTAGNFIHVGDGPRGWVTPLNLSNDGGSIVIPGIANAALIDLGTPQSLLTLMPFEGKLRASCILSNKVLMLNSSGKLFISGDVA